MPVANSPESLALTEEERSTIVKWVEDGGLRGVPPPPGAAKSKAERIEMGRRLFTSVCAACHQPTGRGLPNVFPPLAGSDYLNANKDRAIQTVIFGRQGEVVVNGQKFNNSMPSFPLNDENIAECSDVRLQLIRKFRTGGDAGRSQGPPLPAAPFLRIRLSGRVACGKKFIRVNELNGADFEPAPTQRAVQK